MQKTDFAFEVLIHDDASTDGTQDIIREYEQKYPDLIKPIYQTENQYSKGKGIIGKLQLGRAQGKYIAICEGDDYWTDPYKLQKQFDVMEKHPEVDMCAHAAKRVSGETGKYLSTICPVKQNGILSPAQVIEGSGSYIATNSLLYRKTLNDDIPKFREFLGMDYTLQIHGSLRGGIYFLTDVMSVYRVATPGSWTQRIWNDEEKKKLHLKKMMEMYNILDKETFSIYRDNIEKIRLKTMFEAMSPKEQFRAIRSSKYNQVLPNYSFTVGIKFFIKAYFPWIKIIYRKLKK